MIDVRSGKEITDVVILIEKNKIVGMGPDLKIPDSVQIIALGDVTLLPGLIDAHTHLLTNIMQDMEMIIRTGFWK